MGEKKDIRVIKALITLLEECQKHAPAPIRPSFTLVIASFQRQLKVHKKVLKTPEAFLEFNAFCGQKVELMRDITTATRVMRQIKDYYTLNNLSISPDLDKIFQGFKI